MRVNVTVFLGASGEDICYFLLGLHLEEFVIALNTNTWSLRVSINDKTRDESRRSGSDDMV